MGVVRQLVIDLVGVPGEGGGQPTRRLEIVEVDRASAVPGGGPAIPHPHQGMLKNGELVRVITDIVQQTLDEERVNLGTTHTDGLHDRVLLLVSLQPRD